jgi:putative membrane protein
MPTGSAVAMPKLTRYVPALGAAIALGVGGAGATALAHDNSPQGHHHGWHHHHGHHHYSAWDEQWLQMAIEGDLYEIQSGTLAQQKGASQGVRDYGARLVADHTKSLQEATALAQRLGIEVPKAPTPTQQWQLQILGSFSGAQFDAAYADLEAKDHQQDISEAADEVEDGWNREIRKEAAHEIPVLQAHLKIAESLGGKQGEDPLP